MAATAGTSGGIATLATVTMASSTLQLSANVFNAFPKVFLSATLVRYQVWLIHQPRRDSQACRIKDLDGAVRSVGDKDPPAALVNGHGLWAASQRDGAQQTARARVEDAQLPPS